MTTVISSVLALDVGQARVGVAIASTASRLASPLTTLQNDARFFDHLQALITEHHVEQLVVGLPRNLQGQATAQTTYVEQFAAQLQQHTKLAMHWQDEAVTSKQAEAELQSRKKAYTKADIDALSATYILEDFLRQNDGQLA